MKNVMFIGFQKGQNLIQAQENIAERLLALGLNVEEMTTGLAVYDDGFEDGEPGVVLVFADDCVQEAEKAAREFSEQFREGSCPVAVDHLLRPNGFAAKILSGDHNSAAESWQVASDIYEGPCSSMVSGFIFEYENETWIAGSLITKNLQKIADWRDQVCAVCHIAGFEEPEFF